MAQQIVIDRRFRGPPESGNGGYSSGALGVRIGDTAEVTLRRPPPLDVAMPVEHLPDGALAATYDGSIVIEARPASLGIELPGAVSVADAGEAATRYGGFRDHAFPECFVCGPERAEGDGLRIFPGELDGSGACAAPWVPHDRDAGEEGFVRPEIVWAALDCPTGWAIYYPDPDAGLSLLGRLTARLLHPIQVGATFVAAAWPTGGDGRKRRATSAIFSEEGDPLALAEAVWIELRN